MARRWRCAAGDRREIAKFPAEGAGLYNYLQPGDGPFSAGPGRADRPTTRESAFSAYGDGTARWKVETARIVFSYERA